MASYLRLYTEAIIKIRELEKHLAASERATKLYLKAVQETVGHEQFLNWLCKEYDVTFSDKMNAATLGLDNCGRFVIPTPEKQEEPR